MRTFIYSLLAALAVLCSCADMGRAVTNTGGVGPEDSLFYPKDSIPVDSDEVHVCVSEDGRMKFYSWNTGMGGTCPDFAVLCQFRGKDGMVHIEDFREKEVEAAWVSSVHSIVKDDGSTYYITTRSHRASSNDGYMWMDAFVIDKDTLRNVSVLDSGEDLDECMLETNYVISDWSHATNGEGWGWLYEYDPKARNLYVPIVVLIDGYVPVISDRYRVYHFDGMQFVAKGETAHPGLHESLHDYSRLASFFRTGSHIVRVDVMPGGDYRYASWKATSGMGGKPDLVLSGGVYDEGKGTYTFTSDGVEYIVGHCEDKPLGDEVSEHHEFLLVKRNGKVLLKEERL